MYAQHITRHVMYSIQHAMRSTTTGRSARLDHRIERDAIREVHQLDCARHVPEHPPRSVELPHLRSNATCSVQHATCNSSTGTMQQIPNNIQHALACNVRHAACHAPGSRATKRSLYATADRRNARHSMCSERQAACSARHAACNMPCQTSG